MRLALVAFLVAFGLASVSGGSPARADLPAPPPLNVVASFSILGDFARQVGGEDVHVTNLVGPDGDAHVYNPTPRDSQVLAEADVVLVNGLGFDPWMTRLVAASGFKGRVIVTTEGIAPRHADDHDEHADGGHTAHVHESAHEDGGVDPHAWQDVANARVYVRNITEALAAARPDVAPAFRARAATYDAQLVQLDAVLRADIGALPPAQRVIITSHDAFGYFGVAYGVTFLAPQGLSTDMEPTAAQVARLITQMKARHVRVVFFENKASPRLMHTLAREAGATVGEPVYADALTTMSGPAPTYIALMRHNLAQFQKAMAPNGH